MPTTVPSILAIQSLKSSEAIRCRVESHIEQGKGSFSIGLRYDRRTFSRCAVQENEACQFHFFRFPRPRRIDRSSFCRNYERIVNKLTTHPYRAGIKTQRREETALCCRKAETERRAERCQKCEAVKRLYLRVSASNSALQSRKRRHYTIVDVWMRGHWRVDWGKRL